MAFQSDYVPVWESGPQPDGDFETTADFESSDETAVEGSPTAGSTDLSGFGTDLGNREDLLLAIQAANLLLFAAAIYLAYKEA